MRRARLRAGYRKGGVQHPPGTEIDLADEDLAILGDDAEVLGDAGTDRDPAPAEVPFEGFVKDGLTAISGQLQALGDMVEGLAADQLVMRSSLARIEQTASAQTPPADDSGSGPDGEDPHSHTTRAEAAQGEASAPPSIAAIAAAAAALDPEDPDVWTGRGRSRKPKVAALEAALGADITQEARDAAWAQVTGGRGQRAEG